MDKYTYNRRPAKKAEAPEIHWWRKLAAAVLFLGLVAGIFLFTSRDKTQVAVKYTAYTQKVKAWLVDRKGQMKKGIARVKQAAKPAKEEPIKYEFYSSLPKRKLANLNANNDPEVIVLPRSTTTALNKTQSHVSSKDIFSAERLEKELAEHVSQAE